MRRVILILLVAAGICIACYSVLHFAFSPATEPEVIVVRPPQIKAKTQQEIDIELGRASPATRSAPPGSSPTPDKSADHGVLGEWTENEFWFSRTANDIAGIALKLSGTSATILPDLRLKAGRFTAIKSNLPACDNLALKLEQLWDPRGLSAIATTLGVNDRNVQQLAAGDDAMMERMLTPTGDVLARENIRISTALVSDPGNATAHQEAALLLGVLGLRECAGDFSDTRTTICRMTAHLAIAHALRGGKGLAPVGVLADLVQRALVGRANDVVERVPSLRSHTQVPEAWAAVLLLRATGDWRKEQGGEKTTLLERMEHLRALVTRTTTDRAAEDLERQPPPTSPDWANILLSRPCSVATSATWAQGSLPAVLREFKQVWMAETGKDLRNDDLHNVINQPSHGFYDTPDDERVISRGLWAEWAQRHLLHAQASVYRHFANGLGLPAQDVAQRMLECTPNFLVTLELYPFLQCLTAPDAESYSWAHAAAAKLARHQPGRVSSRCFSNISMPRRFDSGPVIDIGRAVPDNYHWSDGSPLMGTSYEFPQRYAYGYCDKSIAMIAALHALNRFDAETEWYHYSFARAEAKAALPRVDEYFEHLAGYDLSGLNMICTSLKEANDESGYEHWMLKFAEVEPAMYFQLGRHMAELGKNERAAELFEKGRASWKSAVGVANSVQWLVLYYADHGRVPEATAIAREAYDVHSAAGIKTKALLEERLGNLRQAERDFMALHERYDENEDLLRLWSDHHQAFEKTEFPGGVPPVGLAQLEGGPHRGAVFKGTSKGLIDNHLKPGHIIVGIEGQRVASLKQYILLRERGQSPDFTLIVWDGLRYEEVRCYAEKRRFGARMADFSDGSQDTPAANPIP